MSYQASASEGRGIRCPHCHGPLGVRCSWPAGRDLIKRRRLCENADCPYRLRSGEAYAETTEERRTRAARAAVEAKPLTTERAAD